jgi:proteasome lid subunit RPN8/RPN11
VLVSYVFVLFPVVAVFGSALFEGSLLPALAIVLAVAMLAAFSLTMTRRRLSAPAPAQQDEPDKPDEPVTTAGAAPSPTLQEETLRVIYAHANVSYPAEACGFVHASGRVSAARNAADEMHWQDPERFPRTAATGYVLAPVDLRYLEDHIDSDDPVVVIYHSHPNGRAYFSDEDRRNAVIEGVPVYPSLEQLVVGVDAGGVREARLFRFADGDFVECGWVPGPSPEPAKARR